MDTHDFKYYDQLPEKYKEIFHKEIEELKVPTAVSTIIKNHLTYTSKDFPHIGRVQGPASMYKLRWVNPKNPEDYKIFYLFGDIHVNEVQCPPNQDVPYLNPLLKEHISKSDKLIDFFIERAHLKEGDPRIASASTSAWGEIAWHHGLNEFYSGWEVANVRMHNADVRDFETCKVIEEKVFSDLITCILAFPSYLIGYFSGIMNEIDEVVEFTVLLIQSIREYEPPKFSNKEREEFIQVKQIINRELSRQDIIKRFNLEITRDNVIQSIPTFSKTLKQIQNIIDYPKIRNHLLVDLDIEVSKFLIKLGELKEYLKETKFSKKKLKFYLQAEKGEAKIILGEHHIIRKYAELINNLIGLPQDFLELYFLGRCFRQFKVTKNFPKDPPKHIIAYFGVLHVERIKEYLLAIPFEAIIEKSFGIVEGVGRQCLDLEINEPMF